MKAIPTAESLLSQPGFRFVAESKIRQQTGRPATKAEIVAYAKKMAAKLQ